MPLRLSDRLPVHQPDQVVASAGAGSLPPPGADLAAQEPATWVSNDRQLPQGDKHKLIVASAVVNDSSDAGQLHAMAKAAKEALEAETLQVLADAGYYRSAELKACEDDSI